MDTDQQLGILQKAAAGTLPASIDSASPVPVLVVKDLVESGHLEAIDISDLDGPGFLDARITTLGREHLRALDDRAHSSSVPGKVSKHSPAVLKWVFGILAALLVAYLTKQFIA